LSSRILVWQHSKHTEPSSKSLSNPACSRPRTALETLPSARCPAWSCRTPAARGLPPPPKHPPGCDASVLYHRTGGTTHEQGSNATKHEQREQSSCLLPSPLRPSRSAESLTASPARPVGPSPSLGTLTPETQRPAAPAAG